MKLDYKDKMTEDDLKKLDEAVEAAKRVTEDDNADKDAIESAAKALNDVIQPIGAKMYEAAKEEKPAEGAAQSAKTDDDKKTKADDAVEGEVVDEK
jgi:molecular chaperone DnaK